MAANRRPSAQAALTAALLAAVVSAVAGCTAADPETTPTALGPSLTSSPALRTVPPEISQYVQAAETANKPTENMLVRTGARPTIADTGQGPQTMVIRDQDEKEWKAGRYRLVVYCVGEGELYSILQIGATSQSGSLPCAATPQVVTVQIDLLKDATGMTVHIVPVGDTVAGVAYQVQAEPSL